MKHAHDDIGDRFKAYEQCYDYALPRRLPLIIRVDGRAFHSLKLDKPFDRAFWAVMATTAETLCGEIQGARWAYFQSDEISIVVRDDQELKTQPWVGKRLSKILSLSAAIATETFNDEAYQIGASFRGHFDSRAFIVPNLDEAINCMIWRQQDAIRNSVSMLARSVFSHKQCDGKSTGALMVMLAEAGHPWGGIPAQFKCGSIACQVTERKIVPQTGETCDRRSWVTDASPPTFQYLRTYLADLW